MGEAVAMGPRPTRDAEPKKTGATHGRGMKNDRTHSQSVQEISRAPFAIWPPIALCHPPAAPLRCPGAADRCTAFLRVFRSQPLGNPVGVPHRER